MNTANKNIVLRENGEAKVFSVNALEMKTAGKTVKLIPTDRYALTEIEVDRNGVFSASQYGTDGFSRVKVNVELPYKGTTRSGVNYEIYEDVTGKPHIEVIALEDNG